MSKHYTSENKNEDYVLKLQNLNINFGGLKAVDNVNLEIFNGELRGLIGPNGAGKSTIFKLITGVHQPTSGQIIFNGIDITKFPIWKRARLGISIKMQIPGVFGELTVHDNMYISGQNYLDKKNIDSEIKRISKIVNIEHLLEQKVKNLSHGQQQWLEMGMSLATNPKLMLLDEPVAGMGPEETAFTAEIIKRLSDEGVSIIFIDHDMEFVKQLSKKLTVLHQGAVFAEGEISEIEENEEVREIYLGN